MPGAAVPYNGYMKWRYLLPSALTAVLSGIFIAPKLAHAASGFFGPIYPKECLCPTSAPDFGCILTTLQHLINFGVSMTVILVVLIAAYAGVQFILSGGSPEVRSQAKNMLLNVVLGLALVLCAWLIVDFVMKTIYDKDKSFSGQNFGPWNEILAGNGVKCIKQTDGESITNGAVAAFQLQNQTLAAELANSPLARGTGGACDASKVKAGAAAGGYTLTSSQANVLACIANYESSCGVNNLNYKWGSGSSAAGAFQVLLSDNSKCYDNRACEAAVGASGPLNCKSAFSGGNPIPGNPLADTCATAAKNLSCSSSAAACLLKAKSGSSNQYSDWIADPHASGQASCIAQGG